MGDRIIAALLIIVGSTATLWARESDVEETPVESLTISGEFFLTYMFGEEAQDQTSAFVVNRAYVTVASGITPDLGARITFDTNQDGEGDGEGDMEVRLKYAYGEFVLPDLVFLRSNRIEFGIVHAPWLSFEEHVTRYRLREQMFVERSGIVNSADFGVTVFGLIGPTLNGDASSWLGDKFLGRHGSFAFGVYNGGGYHAPERNLNKVAEARLTWRPVPDHLPGLQVSVFGITGEGNREGYRSMTPDWNLLLGMVSLKTRTWTLALQGITGEGNQSGRWVSSTDSTQALKVNGASLFGEVKLTDHWRLIGGVDRFDREEGGAGQFTRAFTGVGYDLGGGNLILLDYDLRRFDDESIEEGRRLQLAMKLVI
jgi:hypothetical protein